MVPPGEALRLQGQDCCRGNALGCPDPRSRSSVYLGHSPHHAGNVALATDEAFTTASMWYEGEVAHTDDQDNTPTSTDSKIDISTFCLRKSNTSKT
eukprot:14167474-Ditylum_brightwellii.AAC.1